MRLGKQARDDGASDSDNVLGDVVEALIGALYLDAGLDAGRAPSSARAWGDRVDAPRRARPSIPNRRCRNGPRRNNRKPPVYEVIGRSGPHHAPRFTVRSSIKGVGEAEAEGARSRKPRPRPAQALLEQARR